MKERKNYLDVIKVISIINVFFGHTGYDGMHMYEVSTGFNHYMSFFIREFSHYCSFMFFLISGVLLLKKEEDLKTVLKKRVGRYVVLVLVVESIRIIYYHIVSGVMDQFSFKVFFKTLYSTNVIEQYWFLHSYLAFLILLPFIRMIAKSLTKQTALYLLSLLCIFEVILVFFEAAFHLDRIAVALPLLNDIFVLPLMGYCVEYVLNEWLEVFKNRLMIYVFTVVSFVAELIYTYHMYTSGQIIPEMSGCYFVLTIGFYIFLRQLMKGKAFKEKTMKFFTFVGGSTLVIYIFEPELRELTHPVYNFTVNYITWLPALTLWLCCGVLVGSLLAWVLRKIPGINKFI